MAGFGEDLWLFGGFGASVNDQAYYNDLWMFDAGRLEWLWVAGDSVPNAESVFGELGATDPASKPGARNNSCGWWTSDGSLWIFGGHKDGILTNELWQFDSGSSIWRWVAGSKESDAPGAYGIKGTPNIQNTPGARSSSACWGDEDGRLWVFGGNGHDAAAQEGYLQDLWMFDPSLELWTWVEGSNAVNILGTYEDAGGERVWPGGRAGSVVWRTQSRVWLFGGYGFGEDNRLTTLNDLWLFELSNGASEIIHKPVNGGNPVYGERGVPDSSNVPGGRWGAVSLGTLRGCLYLFGGYSTSTDRIGELNDLWEYCTSNSLWTWQDGNTIPGLPGVFGLRGVPHEDNLPGAKAFGSGWGLDEGRAFLFGGRGQDSHWNDLWRLDVASLPTSTGPPRMDVAGSGVPYPNPAKSSLTIPLEAGAVVRITLVDYLGRSLMEYKVFGESEITWHVDWLPRGLYLLSIEGPLGRRVSPVVLH